MFVQLEAASYHVQQPYLRLRDSSFQSETLCVRNLADLHSPASHLQNQVLVPELKLQPLSVTQIPEVCSKMCDLSSAVHLSCLPSVTAEESPLGCLRVFCRPGVLLTASHTTSQTTGPRTPLGHSCSPQQDVLYCNHYGIDDRHKALKLFLVFQCFLLLIKMEGHLSLGLSEQSSFMVLSSLLL